MAQHNEANTIALRITADPEFPRVHKYIVQLTCDPHPLRSQCLTLAMTLNSRYSFASKKSVYLSKLCRVHKMSIQFLFCLTTCQLPLNTLRTHDTPFMPTGVALRSRRGLSCIYTVTRFHPGACRIPCLPSLFVAQQHTSP